MSCTWTCPIQWQGYWETHTHTHTYPANCCWRWLRMIWCFCVAWSLTSLTLVVRGYKTLLICCIRVVVYCVTWWFNHVLRYRIRWKPIWWQWSYCVYCERISWTRKNECTQVVAQRFAILISFVWRTWTNGHNVQLSWKTIHRRNESEGTEH